MSIISLMLIVTLSGKRRGLFVEHSQPLLNLLMAAPRIHQLCIVDGTALHPAPE
jgi:hypothetical protein